MIAFLCLQSTSSDVGIVSSTYYVFICNASLDENFCDAIITDLLFGRQSKNESLLLKSPVASENYSIAAHGTFPSENLRVLFI